MVKSKRVDIKIERNERELFGNRNARINSYLMPNILVGLLIVISIIAVSYGLTFFNDSTSFSSGTLTNTEMNGTFIQLSTNSIAKELPDNGVDSSNLWTGVNMTGNVLLLHLDNVSSGSALSTSDSLGVGLKALWHFNGNANDTIGNNNLTSFGTISYPNTRLAQGALFISANATLNSTADIGITGAQEWTTSSWFNLKALGTIALLSFGTGVTNYNYSQQVVYSGKAQCGGSYYTSNAWVQTDTINVNNWYNLVCVYNGTNVLAYLNGIYYATAAYTLSIPDSGVQIGSSTPANTINGTIDEVAIWNRSLSASEVSTLYSQQAQRVLDTSGSLINGTLVTGVNGSSGKLSNGLNFDGRDGYLNVNTTTSNTNLNLTGNISLSAWVKWDSADANSWVIQKTNTAFANDGYGLYAHNDNKIYFYYKNTTNAASKAFTADHLWHHVVGVYNGTSNRIWVDGVEGTPFNAASIASSPSPSPLEIGRLGSNTYNFNGSLDEVAIWNRSLTDAEVLNIYNRQKGNFINKGTYTSSVLDARISTNWTSASFSSAGAGNLNLSIRNCTISDCSDGIWSNIGNNVSSPQTISINNSQYMQYKFDFESLDEGNSTPQLYNVSLDYIDYYPTLSFIGDTPSTGANVSSSSVVVNMTSIDEGLHYSLVNLDNSLVGWWRFENSTSAIDEMGVNNGTLVGGVSTGVGKFGQGYAFDGVNDWVNVSNSINPVNIAVSAWVNANVNNKWQYVAAKDGQWNFGRDSDGHYYFAAWNTAGQLLFDEHSSATASTGSWEHVIVTYNGVNVMYYVNNSLVINATTNNPNGLLKSSSSALSIGSQNPSSNFWNGSIDEVIIFNRSLTANEIASLYNSTASKYYNNFTSLSQGSHSIKGYAVDVAGNLNSTETRTFNVDTVNPSASIVYPLNNSNLNNGTALNFTANFSDSNLKNATLNIYNSTGLVNQTETNFAAGTINTVIGTVVTLIDGVYNWWWSVWDFAGNSGTSGNYSLTVDTVNPSVTIVSPINTLYASSIGFNVTLNENGSIQFSVDSGVTNYTMSSANNQNFNYTLALATGSYTFSVYANDSAGNRNDTSSVSFSVDADNPSLTFQGNTLANNSYINYNLTVVNISSSDANSHYSFVDFDRSLMLWYRMDDVNGSLGVTDLSSYSNNGSSYSDILQNSSGKFGKAMQFNGSNSDANAHAYILANNVISPSKVSVCTWVKIGNTNTANSNNYIVAKYTGTLNKRTFGIWQVLNTNTLGFTTSPTGSYVAGNSLVTTSSMYDGLWHHVCGIHNGTYNFLYLDGTLNASATATAGLYASDEPISISCARVSGACQGYDHFNGLIDEVMIFNRSLSAGEVQSLYNATAYQYYNNFTNLVQGQHNYTAYAVDSVANINSSTRTFTVDTTNPNGTILNYANNSFFGNGTGLNFTVNLTDNLGIKNATLNIYNSTGLVNETTTNFAEGTVSTVIGVVENLLEGVYNWWWDIWDYAGNNFVTGNSTLTVDLTKPVIEFISPTLSNNSGTAGDTYINVSIFDLNFANVTYYFNGTSVTYNNTNENVTNLGGGNWVFTYVQYVPAGSGVYLYNVSAIDYAGNSNNTETRTVNGNVPPSFSQITTTPGITDYDNLDPGVNVSVSVNVTDITDNFEYAMIQWKNSTGVYGENNITLANITEKLRSTLMNATLPLPSYETNVTFRIWANDSAGAVATGSNYSLWSYWDCTWNATSDLGAVVGYNTNKNIGYLIINNTGDVEHANSSCTLQFRVSYDLSEGRVFYDGEYVKNLGSYTVSAKSIQNITINATFANEIKQENLIITTDEFRGRSETRYRNTSATLVTNQNGPYLYEKITSSPGSIYLTPGNFSLQGYFRNLMGSATANDSNTAFNVSFYWALSSGLTNLSGETNISYVNVSDNILNYINATVGFSSLASFSAGVKEITLNAYGYNLSGSLIVDASNRTIISESVNVTFLCYNVSDGVYVTACGSLDGDYPTPSTSSSSSSSGGGGGGGAGGGGAATRADYQFVRGKTNEIIIPFVNKDQNQSLKGLRFVLSGELAKYMEIVPSSLDELEAGKSINLIVKVTSPGFIRLGQQTIMLEISGNKDSGSYNERRNIVLQVNDISKEDAFALIGNASALMKEFDSKGFNYSEVDRLVEEMNKAYSDLDYLTVRNDYGKLREIVNSALEAENIISELKDLINQSKEKGIDVSGSERILKLAELSLGRNDYSEALARAKESQVTFALEVKGEIAKFSYYLKNNKKEISLSAFFLVIIGFAGYKGTQIRILAMRIKGLREEERILHGLMKAVQRSTFTDKRMSMEEYRQSMEYYEKRLSNVIEQLIELESKRAHALRFTSDEGRLKAERERIIELIKEIQREYLKEKTIETKSYELRLESYNKRLGMIDEKVATLEAKQALKGALR